MATHWKVERTDFTPDTPFEGVSMTTIVPPLRVTVSQYDCDDDGRPYWHVHDTETCALVFQPAMFRDFAGRLYPPPRGGRRHSQHILAGGILATGTAETIEAAQHQALRAAEELRASRMLPAPAEAVRELREVA